MAVTSCHLGRALHQAHPHPLGVPLPWGTKIDLFVTIANDSEPLTVVTTQQTFQSCFNVDFRLIWCRDVAQHQINVEINESTLCLWRLEYATLNNVESMLSISKLIWTTLDNVETTLYFLMSILTTSTSKQPCEYDQLKEKILESQKQNNIFEFQIKIN